MSKVHKKKRVARVNTDITRDGFSNGCFDLIDPIIKGMDFNISTKVQSNNFKTSSKVDDQEKINNLAPSTSKEYTQDSIRSKKFGLPRKFPLMEKTQRTLKHIKHNQRIPKQRAHLANLSVTPIKKNNAQNNSGAVAQNKSKNKLKINNKKSESQNKSSGNVASMTIKSKNISQNKNFSISSESEEDSSVNCSKMSKVSSNKSINKKNVEKTYNYRVTKKDNLSSCSKNVINNSDGDTTDSEYEKFIQNNKKELVKRKQKNKGSTKANKKAKKSYVHSKVSKVNHSDSSSDAFSYKTCETTNRLVETESEYSEIEKDYWESDNSLMNYETYTRDSSSESDVANFEETVHNLVDSQLVEQRSNEKLIAETQSFNVINNLPNTCSEHILSDDKLVSTKCVEQDNTSNISSMLDTAVYENMSGNISVLSSLKEDTHLRNISQNISQIDNEESDIEIIEEVAPKLKNREVGTDNNPCVNVNDTKNMNLNEENCQSSVKIKVLPICEIKNETQKKQYNDEKHGAVYTTDICNKEIDSKVNVLNPPPSDKNISEICVKLNCEVKKEDSDDDIIIECIVPAKKGKFENSTLNKLVHGETAQVKTEVPKSFISDKTPNVKSENRNFISTSKEDSSSCSSAKSVCANENVSLKDLKLYEVACSNLAYTANLTGKMHNNFKTSVQSEEPAKQNENKDIKHLIELFKKEFQVYEEILQTESNVEASLKLLETRQAKKLQSIRSLISKYLGNKQCDNLNIDEQRNLMLQTQKMSETEASSKAISDIFLQKPTVVQNVCSSQKIMPSSAVDKDEKPNLSLSDNLTLSIPYQQSLLKPKSEPYDSSNTFSLLGEKCNLCGKEAMAACQRCAKVFFCSNECGKKFWEDGHGMECGT